MGFPEDVNTKPPGGSGTPLEAFQGCLNLFHTCLLTIIKKNFESNHYKRKELTMKTTVLGLILCLVFLAGSAYSAEKKIVLSKYPDLKIGFTTANFLMALPVSLENAVKLIDFADEQGFSWIELRDPMAVLTLDECKQIASHARSKKIEVIYAVAVGLMDSNFWEVYSRAIANAGVFDGPRVARTAAPGVEFPNNPKKTAWTFPELKKVVATAKRAGNLARAFGLKYATENGNEPIKGDGITSFGTSEYFANVNSNVGWQMDTANFFTGGRNVATPGEAQAFLEKHIDRLAYIHMKASSKEHKAQPVLTDNELDFNVIFSLMTQKKIPYVAVELFQVPTLEEIYSNHKKSIEYLKNSF
jgi:sugar phosphate isomerase/epimerase